MGIAFMFIGVFFSSIFGFIFLYYLGMSFLMVRWLLNKLELGFDDLLMLRGDFCFLKDLSSSEKALLIDFIRRMSFRDKQTEPEDVGEIGQ